MLITVENREKQWWKTCNKLLEKNVISTCKNGNEIYTTPIIKIPNWKPYILHKLIMLFLTEITT